MRGESRGGLCHKKTAKDNINSIPKDFVKWEGHFVWIDPNSMQVDGRALHWKKISPKTVHESFLSLERLRLPSYLRPVISFAYRTGWRKSEILNLTWDRVDLREGLVRLDAGDTKNDEGRTVYLDPELRDILKEQLKVRRLGFPYVFHREGERISGFRKSWISACKKTKLGDRLFHDFRRTAIRNLVRSGVPERVAMMISGHKTRSVFERYNVVSPDDLKQAALRQGAYLRGLEDQSQVKTGAV